jgi:hypothetical protein
VSEYPLARDHLGTRRTVDQAPSLVALKSRELSRHGSHPVRLSKCGTPRRLEWVWG